MCVSQTTFPLPPIPLRDFLVDGLIGIINPKTLFYASNEVLDITDRRLADMSYDITSNSDPFLSVNWSFTILKAEHKPAVWELPWRNALFAKYFKRSLASSIVTNAM